MTAIDLNHERQLRAAAARLQEKQARQAEAQRLAELYNTDPKTAAAEDRRRKRQEAARRRAEEQQHMLYLREQQRQRRAALPDSYKHAHAKARQTPCPSGLGKGLHFLPNLDIAACLFCGLTVDQISDPAGTPAAPPAGSEPASSGLFQ
ncbi:hypothetical protein [Leucobacter sp. OH1287]|uniref:hypothetical protein n=1 Tax=Leucobacter sp. OH1287 TaxID=2491049 RepID=UPI000F5DC9DD|nr:hypothetical protein [Leucobacter sp. OH1287]RRD61358.1 hypothetical protein EII30_02875 [Leucobacter sp. OH1287]